ncbi:MAG: TVP38/TMEM64 family protein [Desulfobulbaceae bacterium]|nr:MAG: TVP38/TMEM64 family protein [Desulfobulbaceae bacterium]
MKDKLVQKIVIVALGTLAAALYFFLDLDHYLTLEYVKASQARFQELYAGHGTLVVAGYMAIYIAVTALSLPGATIMTLVGGALFGLAAGTVIISFASTIGATLACFVSRFILRDWVQRRFGQRLAAIDQGVAREGGFYLFTLRLVPVFPFFLINLAMGVTRLPLWKFYWISQLGMLPGTIVYVNAGKELGRIDSLAGILSPSLFFSFVLLGLFPLTTKKILAAIKKRRGLTTDNPQG